MNFFLSLSFVASPDARPNWFLCFEPIDDEFCFFGGEIDYYELNELDLFLEL